MQVESSSRVAVDFRKLPGIKRLAGDYVFEFGKLAPFFSGDPTEKSAWAAAIARTQAHPRRPAELAAVIAGQQKRRGASGKTLAAAAKLADPNTVAIVTGQQAGLFGGPLYTVLKALTAIKLAEQVSRDHNVTVVPIFWIEAEDHDWDEVRSCTVLDAEMAPKTVGLAPRSGEPIPVAAITVDEQIASVLSDLEQALPATEFRDKLLADLRAAYAPGTGMAEAFGRVLERLLGEHGLVVYDASDPAAKPLLGDLFARELSTPGQTASLAAAAGSDLTARGYHAQVQPADQHGVSLFKLDGGRRQISQPAALIKEATDRPAGFSPGVLLRPIVQDTVLPTICYVAGPNELAYLGQLRQVYDRFGVPMPLMYSRATATILDSAAVRFLSKSGMPFEQLQVQDDSALNDLLKLQIPPDVDDALTAAGRAIEERMSRVIDTVPLLDPTLEGAARNTLGKIQKDLESLQGKTIQAAKKKNETLRRQFQRTRALAFPDGHPQERTIGVIWFLNQYGDAFVERLWQELPLDMGTHWVVTI
ncbi:MAG TPA: bacillithiol biosynthesis cysteine-adding enzyme BshC [Vicinamibacterales bacterium]|nr:bacillithiol biosynthesis cysteine-adding enzyme BshC [Vicinamibacterales bacterium]